MTKFDPAAFLRDPQKIVDGYDEGAPAVLIKVYRNGVSTEAANGTVGYENNTPATNEDKFEIGSQTKMMTATVLLQLASEGKLSLDDKLSDVMDVSQLTGIANVEQVTLRQLLTHSSGIPDYSNDFVNEDGVPYALMPLLQDPPQPVGPSYYLDFLNSIEAPANFEPGTDTKYSNTGFLLLGMAIESVTGNSIAGEFQTRIFDPAGMTSTSLPGFGRPDGILQSYVEVGGIKIEATNLPVDDGADGGVVSTTGDMVRFMKALAIDQTLVPEDQLDALEQFFAAIDLGGDIIGHGGGTVGTFSATYVHLPTGTIFSAAETLRSSGSDFIKADLLDAMISVLQNESWQLFEDDGGPLDFALTAAELDVSEAMGIDGSLDTVFNMGGVALTLDGGLGAQDTDRMSFEDGSVLYIADEDGARFSVRHDAKDALDANNQLIGLGGDDRLIGGRGDDKIIGGNGDDRLFGKRGDDVIDGGAGDDRLYGHRGDDQLNGGEGDDHLQGGRGNDIIKGGNGDDIVRGGCGDDTIVGGEGDDVLFGGGGADTFVFAENSGDDQIFCFESGEDKIDLSALGISFDEITIEAEWWGLASEISFEGGSIWVFNPDATLTESDFLF